MSGGSWDYIYNQFEDVAIRLKESDNILRKTLGFEVGKIAKLMHAIEWADSGDTCDEAADEAIKKYFNLDFLSEVKSNYREALKDEFSKILKHLGEKDE